MTTIEVMPTAAWSRRAVVRRPAPANLSPSASAAARDVRSAEYRPFVESRAIWLNSVVEEMLDLFNDPGLDVTETAISGMLELVDDSVFTGAVRPFVGYIEGGGVGLEFRAPEVELQLEVDRGGAVSAYLLYQVAGGWVEWEGPADQLPGGVEKWAWRLAQRGAR
jgi:hypothetical protein